MYAKLMKLLLGLLVCGLVFTSVALAENNQTFVIGTSLGSYNFSDSDLNKIENLLYGSEFAEWYILDEIGIGLRSHKFYTTNSSDVNGKILMVLLNLSVTWVFLGSSDDFRMAVYYGNGPGGVSYSNDQANIDISATANTSSGGIFMDWGGSKWGMRLGYHVVSAKFDYEEGPIAGTIDSSGSSFDLGLRLAF